MQDPGSEETLNNESGSYQYIWIWISYDIISIILFKKNRLNWPDFELRLAVDALLLVEGLGERPLPECDPLWFAILSFDISLVIPAADRFGGGLFGV